MTTQEKILKYIIKLYANGGFEGMSMRQLASKVGIVQSVLYHYFPDKDRMLRYMYDTIQNNLEIERTKLPIKKNTFDFLKQRIEFQFDHAEEIVAAMKYFYNYRRTFKRNNIGFFPKEMYASFQEALEYGIDQGDIPNIDVKRKAKIMTHLVNSIILEYFPTIPKGSERANIMQSLLTIFKKDLLTK